LATRGEQDRHGESRRSSSRRVIGASRRGWTSTIARPQDGAAAAENSWQVGGRQAPPTSALEQSREPVFYSNCLGTVPCCRLDDRQDDGVQARSVTTSGQQSNAHADRISKRGTISRACLSMAICQLGQAACSAAVVS
jgi:hypothetical protein